jgi:hypothetical protein
VCAAWRCSCASSLRCFVCCCIICLLVRFGFASVSHVDFFLVVVLFAPHTHTTRKTSTATTTSITPLPWHDHVCVYRGGCARCFYPWYTDRAGSFQRSHVTATHTSYFWSSLLSLVFAVFGVAIVHRRVLVFLFCLFESLSASRNGPSSFYFALPTQPTTPPPSDPSATMHMYTKKTAPCASGADLLCVTRNSSKKKSISLFQTTKEGPLRLLVCLCVDHYCIMLRVSHINRSNHDLINCLPHVWYPK